jgi:hypothetical protein
MIRGIVAAVKFRTAIITLSIGMVACAVLSLGAQKKAVASRAASVFTPDKGKLAIKLDGQTVGHEEFEIAPSRGGWLAKGTSEIKPPEGASSKVTGTLTLQSDGAPISYDWSSQAEKTNGAHITFSNGLAKISLTVQGARPFEQDLTFNTPLVTVLDNNLYHQYAVLACVYDWSKRGAQSLPVLIPQELTPGTITVESTGSATADGKTYEGLKVTTSDLEILLLLDSSHRLMRLEVPSAKVSVMRE